MPGRYRPMRPQLSQLFREFATKVAASYGVTMINVLTGFKYIAEQIEHFEATGEHTYMFGLKKVTVT